MSSDRGYYTSSDEPTGPAPFPPPPGEGGPSNKPTGGSGEFSSPKHHGELFSITDASFDRMYKRERQIGEGGQGVAELYAVKKNNQSVIIKTVKRRKSDAEYEILMLRAITKLPGHPNVSNMLQAWQVDEDTYKIVLPYHAGGDLSEMKSNANRLHVKLPETYLLHCLTQLSSGLTFLHENGIAHRDLKPANIMVHPSLNLFDDLKIIDFGLSAFETHSHKCAYGTPKFQPPEAPLAGAKADVWALGGVIHYLAIGRGPKIEPEAALSFRNHGSEVLAYWQNAKIDIARFTHPSVSSAHPGSLSHAEAQTLTFNSGNRLPSLGYSPLLEYHVMRCLDFSPNTRITAAALYQAVLPDFKKQMEFYEAWIEHGKPRMLMNFCAHREPPTGWTVPA